MERTKQAAIATIVALAMMVGWLLTGCSKEGPINNVQLIVNGDAVDKEMPVSIYDERLIVPVSYLEKTFQKKLEWQTAPPRKDGAHFSDQVAVLMYHDIAIDSQIDGIISVERFENQMRMLKEEGFQVISIDDYTSFLLSNGSVPDNAVLITFDDGYESFYKLAYPILKKYEYAAVNFVIVKAIDDRKQPGTAKLTWDQMREMQDANMSFRSHTYDMHRYGPVTEDGAELPVMARKMYDKEAQSKETDEEFSKRVMEDLILAESRLHNELGNTEGALAFPYGAFHPAAAKLAEEAAIHVTFTTREGLNTRLHRTGNRINGAKAGETDVDLVTKLKRLGEQSTEQNHPSRLFIDGMEAAQINFFDMPDSEERAVSLRDFCEFNGWTISWSSERKKVQIETNKLP
jgi:biofilm PGA synthesis lipoprotein PgaB